MSRSCILILFLVIMQQKIDSWRLSIGRNWIQSKVLQRMSSAETSPTNNIHPSQLITQEKNPTQIFVCTNRFCREKGSDATMASFTYLTPQVKEDSLFIAIIYHLFSIEC